MTSQNKLTSQRGSALIVTMLLVSVLLMTALILLQRIVPYAKSVRSMHDASQAYYLARGETEMARYSFLYEGTPTIIPSGNRQNIFDKVPANPLENQIVFKLGVSGNPIDPTTPEISLPFRNGQSIDHVVVGANNQAPLQIKLFPTDAETSIKKFGTSKTNPENHTLYSRNGGGLRFDLRGVDTADGNFVLSVAGVTTGTITLRMQYYAGGAADVKTFTGEYDLGDPTKRTFTSATSSVEGNIQSINNFGSVAASTDIFHDFLVDNDCSSAEICSLSLVLNSTPGNPSSIDFQLLSGSFQIPDLNAVVIGDGLSANRLYYQRIIDLIPTPQDI